MLNVFFLQEIAILGLQNAGKSSYVYAIQTGAPFDEDSIPTVGFNMRIVKKGKVSIKVWDMGGQKQFRGMWERYCRDVDTIVFVVDSADEKAVGVAAEELHKLLEYPILDGIPLLVLLNKNDRPESLPVEMLVRELRLNAIPNRTVDYYSISCKNYDNIDKTLQWLTNQAKS